MSTTALTAAVADVYAAFASAAAPRGPLAACVGCCMHADAERQMREWPLRQLGRAHFYSYNDAAKPEVQPAGEMRYLLPRMLELMAQGEGVHHSTELFLDRVGRCPEGSFNTLQRAALDRFALAYFDAALSASLPGYREDALAVLLMFHIGGFNNWPLLNLWLARSDPQSTVAYVEATYWEFWDTRDYKNPFATDPPRFRQQVEDWILAPHHRRVFLDKLLQPDFQQLAAEQPATGCIPFSTMVDAVVDQLTF